MMSHCIELGQTWSNLVKPGQTWSSLVKLGQTWSNLVKLGQTYICEYQIRFANLEFGKSRNWQMTKLATVEFRNWQI